MHVIDVMAMVMDFFDFVIGLKLSYFFIVVMAMMMDIVI